jgi:hypothetical protein
MSKYEKLRTNPDNWKMRVVYYCNDDPRIIVRNLLLFGWTWNFGHSKVYIAILSAIVSFLVPPYLAWWLGFRSPLVISIIVLLTLATIVVVASQIARDPGA